MVSLATLALALGEAVGLFDRFDRLCGCKFISPLFNTAQRTPTQNARCCVWITRGPEAQRTDGYHMHGLTGFVVVVVVVIACSRTSVKGGRSYGFRRRAELFGGFSSFCLYLFCLAPLANGFNGYGHCLSCSLDPRKELAGLGSRLFYRTRACCFL